MKIVEINGGVFGSTGKIMFEIARKAEERGHQVLCFSPVTKTNKDKEPDHPYKKIGTYASRRICVGIDRIVGIDGFSSVLQTISLLRDIKKFNPDIIHLHSLHGSYVNIGLLFSFIKQRRIKLIWTLHDCWSFTGHCPHFEYVACEKWKTGCSNCSLYKDYPKTLFDNSQMMWRKKKEWFTGVDDAVIVTPSEWLADKVKQSFLKDYPCSVINNGIDLTVFRPFKSDFKERYGITDKYMILGIAFGWGSKKGLDVFIKLAEVLPEEYCVVLVGTDNDVDRILPPNIISIHMTQNQKELADIYSAADLFVNATREDTFPTVNIEALACGTPVVTFRTGGSPEVIDEKCGAIVDKDDVDSLCSVILKTIPMGSYNKNDCVERAYRRYNRENKYRDYVDLFEKINGKCCEE